MPFAIPSLTDLVQRARQSFRVNLPGSDAWIWPNNVGPTAKVIGGMVSEVFGFADYIAKQRFALTADGENLDNHGNMYGLARRPAGPAAGIVTLTCAAATQVALAAVFQRSDGQNFIASAAASIGGSGSLDVAVIADINAASTNGVAGTPLSIISGVTGDPTVTAAIGTDGIIGGSDIEDDETYRSRILFRLRNPPHGGSAADYVLWASSVPGVTRVYVERVWAGGGTVRVFPLMDDLYPATGGIPPAGAVQTVANYIDTVRPAGAVVTVVAPVAYPIAHMITLSPNTVAVQNAVLAELASAFRRLGRVAGGDTANGGLPYLATPLTWSRSWSAQAISNAAGEASHVLSIPVIDTIIPTAYMPTLGTVTFI